jgi:hypothetical protein
MCAYVCIYKQDHISARAQAICVFACMQVNSHVCMYVRTYVRTYESSARTCSYVRTYIHTYVQLWASHRFNSACIFPYIYIYIYIYIHTHIQTCTYVILLACSRYASYAHIHTQYIRTPDRRRICKLKWHKCRCVYAYLSAYLCVYLYVFKLTS